MTITLQKEKKDGKLHFNDTTELRNDCQMNIRWNKVLNY